MDTTVTPYELERLENIRKNKQLLDDLGLNSPSDFVPPTSNTKTAARPSKKRKRDLNSAAASVPTRKSSRLANGTAISGGSFAEVEPSRSHVILRQLTPPNIPVPDEEFDPSIRAPSPSRDTDGTLRFEAEPHFTPNLTPAEMLSMGSFGGTAFRAVYSKTLQRTLPEEDYQEFPSSWFDSLDVSSLITRTEYKPSVNKYGVKAGQSLEEWEAAGWVRPQDPRGWFQWYCRFYLGRRTNDDERQIKRWLGVCGPSGRFKRSLVKKIAQSQGAWDDVSISPVLRQTLQHWGYQLTEADYHAYLP